jgi:Zn-dependent metalloprotease
MSERLAVGQECSDKNDQCEVHGNSTIPGHASYLIAKALEDKSGPAGNRYDRAGTLYYTVLTQYLTANDGFTQAANDTLEACKLLYSATDCSKVQHAFELTGMLRSTGGLSPGSRP